MIALPLKICIADCLQLPQPESSMHQAPEKILLKGTWKEGKKVPQGMCKSSWLAIWFFSFKSENVSWVHQNNFFPRGSWFKTTLVSRQATCWGQQSAYATDLKGMEQEFTAWLSNRGNKVMGCMCSFSYFMKTRQTPRFVPLINQNLWEDRKSIYHPALYAKTPPKKKKPHAFCLT